MKFNVNQQDLQQALNYCQGVIEKRSTLPILSNILIDANYHKNIHHADQCTFISENMTFKSDQCILMAVVAMFKSNQYRWWAKLWCSKPDQCGLIKYSWAKLRCSNIDQLRMIKCSSSCWTARGLMMIGSLMMIKIINNIEQYSFFSWRKQIRINLRRWTMFIKPPRQVIRLLWDCYETFRIISGRWLKIR